MHELVPLHFGSESPMLPSITIQLLRWNIGESLTKNILDLVVDKEIHILNTTTKPSTENDPTWLTSRLWDYNLLDFEESHSIQKQIIDAYKTYMVAVGIPAERVVYIHAWANIIRNNGRNIYKHNHTSAHCEAPEEYSYVSGNICIQAEGTGTYYKSPFTNHQYRIENIAGDMILFPSFIIHWTDVNESDTIRVSIAFDIMTEEVYNIVKNKNFKRVEV